MRNAPQALKGTGQQFSGQRADSHDPNLTTEDGLEPAQSGRQGLGPEKRPITMTTGAPSGARRQRQVVKLV